MSETPQQVRPRHCSPEQLAIELRAQNVPTWHAAYKCPGCGFVQSAETAKRANIPLSQAEDVIGRTCLRCGGSVQADKKTGMPAALDARLIVTQSWPFFEPATPAEAQDLRTQFLHDPNLGVVNE